MSDTDRYTALAPVSMKALTLWQPWASLVAIGAKTIETRSWETKYRGPLAIHAAATMPSYEKRYVRGVRLGHESEQCGGQWRLNVYPKPKAPTVGPDYLDGDWPCPLGALVATCLLTDVVPIRAVDDPTQGQAHVTRARHELRLCLYKPAIGYHSTGGVMATHSEWDFTDITGEGPYGDFTPGRFAWLLSEIRPIVPAIPARGRQQLWTWNPPKPSHSQEGDHG